MKLFLLFAIVFVLQAEDNKDSTNSDCNGVDCTMHGDKDSFCIFNGHCHCSEKYMCENAAKDSDKKECEPNESCILILEEETKEETTENSSEETTQETQETTEKSSEETTQETQETTGKTEEETTEKSSETTTQETQETTDKSDEETTRDSRNNGKNRRRDD